MQHRKFSWLKQKAPCFLTLLIGLLSTVVVFDALSRMEYERLQSSFEQRANLRVAALQTGMENIVRHLKTVNQLFSITGTVTRDQFHVIAQEQLNDSPFIHALSYQRTLTPSMYAAYVQESSRIDPLFQTRQYSPRGPVAVQPRHKYHVIDYVEPFDGNEPARGLDVSTNPVEDDVRTRAITRAEPAVSMPFYLALSPGKDAAVKILMPVYKPGMPLTTPNEREAAVLGQTTAILKLEKAIEGLIRAPGLLDQNGIDFVVRDTRMGRAVLYAHTDALTANKHSINLPYNWVYPGEFVLKRDLRIADSTWQIELEQKHLAYVENHVGSLMSLFSGVLCSVLAACYINTLTTRASRIQFLVDERTYELKKTNDLLVEDNRARKQAEDRLSHMAQHDTLTGLANRTLLLDRLQHAMARGARYNHAVWVIFLDLDRFKSINDSLGHKAGDELLSAISNRLLSVARETDTVARFGGDEFVIVMSEDDEPLQKQCLSRFMDAIAQPVLIDGHDVIITTSVGVSIYPDDSQDAHTLIENADLAMYRSKQVGRNSIQFYTEAMNEKLLEKLTMERALRDAISNNDFVLHYQPQVDLRTNEIVGAEALLRWNHPTYGMIQPADFITMAEETGLIAPIGEWVLRQACSDARKWHCAGMTKIRIGVNVSARQFSHTDLVSTVRTVLKETALDPAYLELELTESCIMADVDKTIVTLAHLKGLGVKLSIDDFGTGYSSLACLQRFPLDVLKIDQSFVHDIKAGERDAAIVASVISLSHNLKLHVIAEGVETLEQLTYLRNNGCDEIQGFIFSKPLPALAFETLLSRGDMFADMSLEVA